MGCCQCGGRGDGNFGASVTPRNRRSSRGLLKLVAARFLVSAAGSRSGRSRNRNTPEGQLKVVSFGRVDSVSVVTHAAGLRSGILDSPKDIG